MSDIALGLEAFAAHVNASYMSQWLALGLYDEDVEGWGQAFEQALSRTLVAGGRFHFNLTGLDIADALKGDPSRWVDRHTAWELQQVVGREDWFANTIFYLDGSVLTLEQLAEHGIRPPVKSALEGEQT